MTIAELLREIRRRSGLSQVKLGQRLGVAFVTINRWENGRVMPSALGIRSIKELLESRGDVDLMDQCFGTEALAERTVLWMGYRRMARRMASMIDSERYATPLAEFSRVDGGVLCSDCGIAFVEHPEVGWPTFHLLCDGTVVKT